MQKQKNTNIKKGILAASVAAVALAALMPIASDCSAWGPERDTYTMKVPADHVTFNSITDNPVLGDERDFVRVAEINKEGQWTDNLKIEAGHTYAVYIGYHNNAASNLNASGVGMANGVKVSAQFPSTVSAKNKGKVSAIISATNATPKEVWDEAYFTTDSQADIVLRYVPASAKIYNSGKANNTTLSEDLFNSDKGVYLGYNSLIGNLPGCAEYSGHIIYYLKAEQVGASVSKTVSTDGVNFFESVTAKPGDTVTYKVVFKNTGNVDLTNVTFHDRLPKGVTLVNGTTKLVNNANPNGVLMVDLIGQNGFNTGLYGSGATATLTYQVKLNDDIVVTAKCGDNIFTNTIYVDHDAGEINDSSSIKVVRTCAADEDDPGSLPTTGPAEIALAVIAATCIVVGIVYYVRSQQEINAVEKRIAGTGKQDQK